LDIEQPTSIPDYRSSFLNSRTPNFESDGISLLDLLLILVKNWKVIVGIPFVVALITAIVTLFMPNIYTAKTMILPGDDDSGGMMGAMMSQIGGLAGLAGGVVGSSNKADLYVTMLKSETIKDPVIDRFKLMEVYDTNLRHNVYKVLDDIAVITTGKKDGVITISVDDKDPKRAAEIANTYVDELGKFVAGLNMTGAGNNRVFLEKRIAESRADLAKAEDALKDFQSKYKAISVTDQAKATIEGVAQLRAQLATQEVELATLQRQFTDSSQEVKALKATTSNLRSQIARLEGAGESSSIPSVGSMPQLAQEYVRLMREFKIQEAVLELLTKQYEISKLSEAKDLSQFKVIQKAKAPERKSKPKRGIIVIMAATASGFFIVMAVSIRELADQMNEESRKRWQQLLRLLPRLPRCFRKSVQI